MSAAGRVLICHREPAAPIAHWLRDQLATTLPGAEVRLGADRPSTSDVVLVVVDPGWVDVLDASLRVAVEHAFAAGAKITTLLVWGAPLPALERLPPSLLPIAQHPVRRIDPDNYNSDTQALVEELRATLGPSSEAGAPSTLTRPPPELAASLTRPPSILEPAVRQPGENRTRHLHPWMLLAVGAVLLGAIAGTVFVNVRDPDLNAALPPDLLPSIPVSDGLPRSDEPLPDNTLIWRRESNGVWNVSAVDVDDGSTGVELAVGQENGAQVISHDRRTVLYLRNRGDGGIALHAVSADGRQDRELFSDGKPSCPRLRRPAWRADGVLAISCGPEVPGDNDTLNLLTLDGTLVRQLDEGWLGDPTFSEDGSRVVYPRSPDGDGADGGALYEVPADGSTKPVMLTPGEVLDDDPVFAPTGDLVAFSRSEGDQHWIATMDLSGEGPGEVQDLTRGEGVDRDPSWSPGGEQIAFRRGEDLYLVSRDGQTREVVDNQENGTKPAWTPR